MLYKKKYCRKQSLALSSVIQVEKIITDSRLSRYLNSTAVFAFGYGKAMFHDVSEERVTEITV